MCVGEGIIDGGGGGGKREKVIVERGRMGETESYEVIENTYNRVQMKHYGRN